MKKAPITLGQLCLMFINRSALLVWDGYEGTPPTIDWLPRFAFDLPEDVREIPLVHLSQKPKSGEYSYYLVFFSASGSEYFAFVGDNNEACMAVCKMFTELAKLLRESFNGSKKERDEQRTAHCFGLYDSDHNNSLGQTEIIYHPEDGGATQTIAWFDTVISLPFDLVEQRKVNSLGVQLSWGHDEDNYCNKIQKTSPTSRVFAHFIPRVIDGKNIAEPIDVPLRIDGTGLPILLFDYMMILGPFTP